MRKKVVFNIQHIDVRKIQYEKIHPCFLCECQHIGLFFVAGKIQKYMTICMHCQLLGGMGKTPEEAIQKWNRKEYTHGTFLRKVKPAEQMEEETGREDFCVPLEASLVPIKTCKRTLSYWSKYYD